MRRISVLILSSLLIASCGGDDAVGETGASTTVTEADGYAPVDGSTVLRTGDCFAEVPASGEDATDVEIVPCDTPHLGEVVCAGAGSACPTAGSPQDEVAALISDYVGVAEDELGDWMTSQQIGANTWFRYDDGSLVGAMWFLLAEEGDLSRSYRATSD